MASVTELSPQEVQIKLEQGAVLIDIRSADEYHRENIAGSVSLPLEQLQHSGLPAEIQARTLIFHCKSGRRTKMAEPLLNQLVTDRRNICILASGLDGWKSTGFTTRMDYSQPLELIRQVHIAAGSLVLIGALLGWLVSPLFYLLCAFVGAGLTFSGVTGFCGMAKLLALMPWNRR